MEEKSGREEKSPELSQKAARLASEIAALVSEQNSVRSHLSRAQPGSEKRKGFVKTLRALTARQTSAVRKIQRVRAKQQRIASVLRSPPKKTWKSTCFGHDDRLEDQTIGPLYDEPLSEQKYKESVRVQLPKAPFMQCYRRKALRKVFRHPAMHNWVQNPLAERMVEEGYGGMPGTIRYYNLPIKGSNVWVTSAVKKALLSRAVSVVYLRVAHANARIGNAKGTFGRGRHHGQLPGFTVYDLAGTSSQTTRSRSLSSGSSAKTMSWSSSPEGARVSTFQAAPVGRRTPRTRTRSSSGSRTPSARRRTPRSRSRSRSPSARRTPRSGSFRPGDSEVENDEQFVARSNRLRRSVLDLSVILEDFTEFGAAQLWRTRSLLLAARREAMLAAQALPDTEQFLGLHELARDTIHAADDMIGRENLQ